MVCHKAPCCADMCRGSGRWIWTERSTQEFVADNLNASDANILESQRAQARGVEQVLGVDNERFLEQLLDPVEIESAKFAPAGADDQGVRSLGHRIRGIAIADR